MSQPIHVDIISDDDDDDGHAGVFYSPVSRRPTTIPSQNPTIVIVDDDPTPQKAKASACTPSFVAETPLSEILKRDDVSMVNCVAGVSRNPISGTSSFLDSKFTGKGFSGVICLESDNELEEMEQDDHSRSKASTDFDLGKDLEQHSPTFDHSPLWFGNEDSVHAYSEMYSQPMSLDDVGPSNADRSRNKASTDFDLGKDLDQQSPTFDHSPLCYGNEDSVQMYSEMYSQPISLEDVAPSNNDIDPEEDIHAVEEDLNVPSQKGKRIKRKNTDENDGKKKMTKEDRMRSMEEKKQKKEQDKLQKAALKAEAAELKKLEKERQRWEKGKLALNSIVAQIDTKVVESGSVGGHLLTRFSEKDLKYRITSNAIERSIIWTLTMPEDIARLSSKGQDISYILLVYEAEEFCKLANSGSLRDCISAIRSVYPSYTICFLTNRLMSYINKREQEHYKNPNNRSGWRRPPVEELYAELITHYDKVHSRQCVDEAEVAEHVVGLTFSLATCQFRKRLTWLSVSANGSIVPNDCPEKNLIKQSPWLKALVAIPKVQPRFAIAIGKKYPTMRSLLTVYMDPTRSVHEKEFLLKDLMTEGLVGGDRRLGEVCSKRVYRILMAQSGNIKTDDVENGADFFKD